MACRVWRRGHHGDESAVMSARLCVVHWCQGGGVAGVASYQESHHSLSVCKCVPVSAVSSIDIPRTTIY